MQNSNSEFTTFREVRGFSETLSFIADIIKSDFRNLWKAIAGNCLPWVVLSLIAFVLASYFSLETLFGSVLSNAPTSDAERINFFVNLLVSQSITLAALYVGSMALTNLVFAYLSVRNRENRFPTQDEVKEQYSATFWKMLLSPAMLYLCATLAAVVIGFMLSMVVGIESGIILTCLIVFPIYIYVSPLLMQILYSMVEDEVNILQAVNRVVKWSKGTWWWTLGIVFVVGLCCSLAGVVFQIPTYVMSMLKVVFEMNAEENSGVDVVGILLAVSTVFPAIAALVTTVVRSVVGVVLYYRIAEMATGNGFQELVDGLGE